MTTPTIGNYMEKKVTDHINTIVKRINELEFYIKTPPFITFYGVMDIPSEFLNDWKAQVNHILTKNNINPNWILNMFIPNQNTECTPYIVTIQFISHCVKDNVFDILSKYLLEFDGVYITKDTL